MEPGGDNSAALFFLPELVHAVLVVGPRDEAPIGFVGIPAPMLQAVHVLSFVPAPVVVAEYPAAVPLAVLEGSFSDCLVIVNDPRAGVLAVSQQARTLGVAVPRIRSPFPVKRSRTVRPPVDALAGPPHGAGPRDVRVPYVAVGLALQCPLAVDPEIITFVYIDPGHQTDRELHSWGAAHGPLWDALRKKGRQVRVIGIAVENAIVDRAARVLEKWAAAEPGTSDEGLTPKQEIKLIQDAMIQNNTEFFVPYGGEGLAMKRAAALMRMPAAKLTEGVSIDDYSTWRAVRFAERDETG